MFAKNIYKDIKVPMFIAQSLYDKWCIRNIVNVNYRLSKL